MILLNGMIHQYQYQCTNCLFASNNHNFSLSTPMGVDYVVIGFDIEVQPLVTHNAA